MFKRLLSVGRLFLAICICIVPTFAANAQTIFFSDVGPPVLSDPLDEASNYIAPAPLGVADAPVIEMALGDTRKLHVWTDFTLYHSGERFFAVALDIQSSHAEVAHPVRYAMSNPLNRTFGVNRWAQVHHGQLGSVGSDQWLVNAYSFYLPGLLIGGTGISNDQLIASGDSGFDSDTGAFYLGELEFHADRPGRTGLYFRTGDFKSMILTGPSNIVPAQLHYGDTVSTPSIPGNVPGGGDRITEDLFYADAIVHVIVPEPGASMLALSGLFTMFLSRRRCGRWHATPSTEIDYLQS